MDSLMLFSPVSLSALIVVALLRWVILPRFHERRPQQPETPQSPSVIEKDPYQAIEPLPDFDWRTVEPIRNAPLKPKYHLTMSIETITLSDLIAMDNTYEERTQVRRQLMDDNTDATIRCNPVCESAVLELNEWIFGTYLPSRFPQTFKSECSDSGRQMLNTVSKQHIPVHPTSATEALRALGENIDTDFLLLLPRSKNADGMDLYHLEAFVCCFPSGFSLRKKIGLPLAAIHIPVPGYKTKLEKSMDRFFVRLECGKIVKRSNWAITTNSHLFSEGGNHLYDGGKTSEKIDEGYVTGSSSSTPHQRLQEAKEEAFTKLDMQAQIDAQKATVTVENCRLRSERQTLFRLPRSRAIVFSFKTYQYRLEDVKREGYGEKLAEAIEGLEKGNVPEMNCYKRGVVWGERIVGYLRG